MPDWPVDDLARLGAAEEVQLATRRAAGSLQSPRTIWVVTSGTRVFIRSTHGRDATWYRAATSSRSGQLVCRGTAYEVTFSEVLDEAGLAAADAGYRTKYRRYPSIVEHLEQPGPRAATLEVHPT